MSELSFFYWIVAVPQSCVGKSEIRNCQSFTEMSKSLYVTIVAVLIFEMRTMLQNKSRELEVSRLNFLLWCWAEFLKVAEIQVLALRHLGLDEGIRFQQCHLCTPLYICRCDTSFLIKSPMHTKVKMSKIIIQHIALFKDKAQNILPK